MGFCALDGGGRGEVEEDERRWENIMAKLRSSKC